MGFTEFNNLHVHRGSNNKNANLPTQVPKAFLEWLVGLFQGEGCISLAWKLKVAIGTKKTDRI